MTYNIENGFHFYYTTGMSIETLKNNLYCFGKYLDQPAVVNGLKKYVPPVAAGLVGAYTLYDTYRAPEGEKKKTFIRDIFVWGFALGTALVATRGFKFRGKEWIKGIANNHIHSHAPKVTPKPVKVHDHDHGEHKHSSCCGHAHAKDPSYMSFSEIKELGKDREGLKKLIPDSHAHTFKEMMKELLYLTKIGTVPVVGGITGGVIGDKINGENIKETVKDKLEEGTFQYLANITLCNAGAGLALLGLNKAGIENKAARFGGMLAGVIGVGLVFGGTIANFIGKNLVKPLVDKGVKGTIDEYSNNGHIHHMFDNVNAERRPEPLDLALHIDDVASVGFLSGMQWIGPILPALYSVSGYRAGIGYRNREPEPDHHKISHDLNNDFHERFNNYARKHNA